MSTEDKNDSSHRDSPLKEVDEKKSIQEKHKEDKIEKTHEHSVRRRDASRTSVLAIKNITLNTNENHLREIFGNYGVVRRVRIARRDHTAISQGIGFIEMNEEDVNQAIDYLDGSQIDGVVVYVQKVFRSPFDEERRPRSHSHHRHRSKSRRRENRNHRSHRSRSRSRGRNRARSQSRSRSGSRSQSRGRSRSDSRNGSRSTSISRSPSGSWSRSRSRSNSRSRYHHRRNSGRR